MPYLSKTLKLCVSWKFLCQLETQTRNLSTSVCSELYLICSLLLSLLKSLIIFPLEGNLLKHQGFTLTLVPNATIHRNK